MIDACRLLKPPKINEPRGNVTFIESNRHIPFTIQRAHYLYDVPAGAERGWHAHKALHQLIISISGSFNTHLDDEHSKKTVHLNRSYNSLYVCPIIWREIDNFSCGAACMLLTSDYYDELDCYREYDRFLADA